MCGDCNIWWPRPSTPEPTPAQHLPQLVWCTSELPKWHRRSLPRRDCQRHGRPVTSDPAPRHAVDCSMSQSGFASLPADRTPSVEARTPRPGTRGSPRSSALFRRSARLERACVRRRATLHRYRPRSARRSRAPHSATRSHVGRSECRRSERQPCAARGRTSANGTPGPRSAFALFVPTTRHAPVQAPPNGVLRRGLAARSAASAHDLVGAEACR